MTHYIIIEETRISEDREYEAYGLEAIDENGKIAAKVADITSDKDKAELLASLCEKLDLSPIHLKDVAEDFIISDTY